MNARQDVARKIIVQNKNTATKTVKATTTVYIQPAVVMAIAHKKLSVKEIRVLVIHVTSIPSV